MGTIQRLGIQDFLGDQHLCKSLLQRILDELWLVKWVVWKVCKTLHQRTNPCLLSQAILTVQNNAALVYVANRYQKLLHQ